jgi:medium-chain acyl-[acyl-carrier-protein] hydrolase
VHPINSKKAVTDPCFPFRRARRESKVRLVCLPFAGGGATLYRDWDYLLPSWIEVCSFELPGRGARFRETAARTMEEAAGLVVDAILSTIEPPVALFGHSMGARVAFEAAAALPTAPLHLFVSGSPSPDNPVRKPIAHLPTPEFFEELRISGGTPDELFDDAELMAVLEPMLRADFGLTENYCGRSQCNHFSITGFAGTQDDEAPISAVAEWERFTTAAFRVIPVAGPHLFLSPQRKFITQVIAAVLSGALRDCGSRTATS